MRTLLLADTAVRSFPAARLLLCCAQAYHDTPSVERLAPLLQADLDWTSLLRMALRHRILPLLYRSLHTACPDAVPQTIRTELHHHFHANAQRNLFLAGTLLQLLRLLEVHNICAIPYKGPVLAAAVYGNLTLRQFGDLDILVRKQDVPRVKALLLAQGYRWWDQRPFTCFPRLRRVYEFVSADGQVLVELHWAITSSTFYFPLDPACLWEHCDTVSMLGTPVRTMAPEHLLLILCVHGAKHHWERLAWICDVAALLRAYPEMDWGQILKQAERLGSMRMLLLGLLLAHTLLEAPLPKDTQQRLHIDPVLASLAAQVCTILFHDASRSLCAVDRPMFYLRLRERLPDRFRCCCYLVYRAVTSRLLPRFRQHAE